MSVQTSKTDRLRFVPPVAALGTAFVLQVVVITDTVGTAMSARYPHASVWPFVAACLLGVSVASCAEGGAAYLMDLYDKHLLARDSVWLLRIAMAVYVAASGLAIHWWTGQRGLPVIISWLLSGMSASALFLWARGARWRNRQQMIAAGQIDPALPRLPMSAKLMHPVRWTVTLFLISWEPVATTSEARARYDAWRDRRTGKTAATEQYVQRLVADAEQQIADMQAEAQLFADAIRDGARKELSAVRSSAQAEVDRLLAEAAAVRQAVDRQAAEVARRAGQTPRPVLPAKRAAITSNAGRPRARQVAVSRADVSVEQLADTLDERSPDRVPGRPTALAILREAHGSCSADRALAAIDVVRGRRNGHREQAPDSERLPLTGQANGHRPELHLIGAAS